MGAMNKGTNGKSGQAWEPHEVPCEMCGTLFMAFGNRARFCPECKEVRERARRDRDNEKRRLKRAVKLRKMERSDTQEQIEVCLNCTKKTCSGDCNTVAAKSKGLQYNVSPEVAQRRERVLALRQQGLTYDQIAETLGCSRGVVNNDLTRLRLRGVYV